MIDIITIILTTSSVSMVWKAHLLGGLARAADQPGQHGHARRNSLVGSRHYKGM